jgi:hypothetical protein
MVVLRADPWNPDYGAGAEAPFEDDAAQVVVDTSVETEDWDRPLRPDPCGPEPVIFVDGVMRIDMRVLAQDGDRRAWGLLGSYAAGGVRCSDSAAFVLDENPVGRALILGGRITSAPLEVTAGGCHIAYEARSIADDSPTTQRRVLQRFMIEAEQRTAMELANGELVFADGPLHINTGEDVRVVGVIKRMVTAYLKDEPAALLPRLQPRERTPVFALGNSVLDRFAWYQRLIPLESTWHELAGLVRCEVRMELGLAEAIRVADRVACVLPDYSGRPGVDPRAPQNLTPVGALESHLRHRLGHPIVIRRALQSRLMEETE